MPCLVMLKMTVLSAQAGIWLTMHYLVGRLVMAQSDQNSLCSRTLLAICRDCCVNVSMIWTKSTRYLQLSGWMIDKLLLAQNVTRWHWLVVFLMIMSLNSNLYRVIMTTKFDNLHIHVRYMLSPIRPFVICLLSVYLSVICNVRAPYSAGWNFWQYFYAVWYLGHPLTSTENFIQVSYVKSHHTEYSSLWKGHGQGHVTHF